MKEPAAVMNQAAGAALSVLITDVDTASAEYTTYTIRTTVEPREGEDAVRGSSTNWTTTSRRYNQFAQLHAELLKTSPLTGSDEAIRIHEARGVVPILPAKQPFKSNRDAAFLEQRRVDLEAFLGAIVAQPFFRTNRDVLSFLGATQILSTHSLDSLSEFQWAKRTMAPQRTSVGGSPHARAAATRGGCVLL